MIDLVKFTIPHSKLPVYKLTYEPKEIFGIECYPYYAKNGFLTGHTGSKNNIYLKVNGRGINFQVGWHTYHSGSNHTDYCRSGIIETYEGLKELTKGLIDEAYIISLESGVNLTDIKFKNWERYKGRIFMDMRAGNKIYGKSISINKRKFKVYDKTFERKKKTNLTIDPALVRIETTLNNKNSIEQIGIYSPKNLTEKKVLNKLSELNQKQIRNVIMTTGIDYSQLSISQLKIVTMMTSSNQEQLNTYKLHKDSYKKDMAKFRNIISVPCKTQQDHIMAKIRSKFTTLINS